MYYKVYCVTGLMFAYTLERMREKRAKKIDAFQYLSVSFAYT